MLRIRLRRMGRRNAPTYRIVIAEKARARDGRIVESIGHYNPRTDPMTLVVDRHRALHWMEMGAVPTDTVHALLKRAGVFRPEEEGGAVEVVKSAVKRVVATAKGAGAKAAKAIEAIEERVEEVLEAVKGTGDAEATAEGEAVTVPAEPKGKRAPKVNAESEGSPEGEAQ